LHAAERQRHAPAGEDRYADKAKRSSADARQRSEDPRQSATVSYRALRPARGFAAADVEATCGDERSAAWYEISERVQEAADKALIAKGKTTLKANVDFFSASVYHVIGILPTFTPVFAILAHRRWTPMSSSSSATTLDPPGVHYNVARGRPG